MIGGKQDRAIEWDAFGVEQLEPPEIDVQQCPQRRFDGARQAFFQNLHFAEPASQGKSARPPGKGNSEDFFHEPDKSGTGVSPVMWRRLPACVSQAGCLCYLPISLQYPMRPHRP